MSSINKSLPARPVSSLPDKAKGEKPMDISPGKQPYTRSSSPTTIASPHIAGAAGEMGETHVSLVGNHRMPKHLLYRNSNNQIGVAHLVNQHKTGDPTAAVDPSAVAEDDLVTRSEQDLLPTTSKLTPEA